MLGSEPQWSLGLKVVFMVSKFPSDAWSPSGPTVAIGILILDRNWDTGPPFLTSEVFLAYLSHREKDQILQGILRFVQTRSFQGHGIAQGVL